MSQKLSSVDLQKAHGVLIQAGAVVAPIYFADLPGTLSNHPFCAVVSVENLETTGPRNGNAVEWERPEHSLWLKSPVRVETFAPGDKVNEVLSVPVERPDRTIAELILVGVDTMRRLRLVAIDQ